MTTRNDGAALRQLKTLFNIGAIRELSDGQLLEHFSTGRSGIAEVAFQALVERHGAMVLRVCRARLVDPHETQDAFQATFLILLKKARSLWVRDSLGPWLHQVAFRTASCARSAAARRRGHERRAAEMAKILDEHEYGSGSELEAALHEEINRLPECYRVPIVLCDLQGFSCEEAARRMGRPVGTVKSWRFRGRARLRERLIRLQLAPSIGPGAALASIMPQMVLTDRTLDAAVRFISDSMTAGEVSASVRIIAKGVLKTMLFSKIRTTATTILAVALLTVGLGAVGWVSAGDSNRPTDEARTTAGRRAFVDQYQPTSRALNEPAETWALSLAEAIRIGLANADEIHVISVGANGTPSKIAPRNRGVEVVRFKAEVMAHVRSIEQQYWNLAQANVAVGSAAKAVELARWVADREQTELLKGAGTVADTAEAVQRFEQFKLDLGTRKSEVITTEHQLRNVMGLPRTDGRRIVTITAPVEARVEPNWEECLAIMLQKQPDIVRMTGLVKEAESDVSPDGLIRLERGKSYQKQVVRQATHSLARFFLEIDANYKQFKTASRLRAAAALRLESQRAYYEERRITIDRILDAVSQYATAVATEAQYKTTYNISIVALEEAKGTLLEHDQITVVDGPKSSVSIAAVPDFAVKGAWNEPPVLTRNTTRGAIQPQGPAAFPPGPSTKASELPVTSKSPKGDPGGKTFSFQFTVGTGSKPLEVRGSFTITPAQSESAQDVW